jgi:hypothetical protein
MYYVQWSNSWLLSRSIFGRLANCLSLYQHIESMKHLVEFRVHLLNLKQMKSTLNVSSFPAATFKTEVYHV